jgi:saccharopine dehydrogenase-like NADP-dependent oxidoreductase
MRVVAVGAPGMMGREAVRDLVVTTRAKAGSSSPPLVTELVVADVDGARAQQLLGELDDPRVKAAVVDVQDPGALAELFDGAALCLNSTTYHHGLTLARAAIAAKVDYVDLGGLVNTPRQLALADEAAAAGVLLCLGAGATPGVTNLMAARGAAAFDPGAPVEEVAVHFGSFRSLAPSPGLLDTILDEFSPETHRFYFEDGKFQQVPAFAGEKRVRFEEPVGEQTTYLVPHSEVHTLPKSIAGARRVSVRGCWQPEIMELLRSLHRFDLLSGPAKTAIRAQLLERQPQYGGEWAFNLRVEVTGTKGGRRHREVLTTSHPRGPVWGQTATARMTGIPASIAAQLILRGQAQRPGVRAADGCFETDVFFAALAERGIMVHQRSEPI